jgi:hypothetical protein
VAYQDVPDVLLAVEGIIDMQRRPAGIAEDVFHTFVPQELDDNLAAAQLHWQFPRKSPPLAARM